MTLQRLAIHYFDNLKDLKFSPSDYSLFKYGSRSLAEQFGADLAQTFSKSPFFEKICSEAENRKIIVMPPPCIHVPTAGYHFAMSFFNHLNLKLYEKGKPHAHFLKIYRQKSYFVDYGNMSSEERRNTLSDEIFRADAAFLKGNICLFVDDIRITGAHEERIKRMLDFYVLEDLEAYYFLFYAVLNQTHDIDPTIESKLNRWQIKDLNPVLKLIKKDDFTINTRVLKFILASQHIDFKEFIDKLDILLIKKIYFAALSNGYADFTELTQNFLYLKYCIGNETTPYLLPD
jgi:predicted DNA-binding protein